MCVCELTGDVTIRGRLGEARSYIKLRGYVVVGGGDAPPWKASDYNLAVSVSIDKWR